MANDIDRASGNGPKRPNGLSRLKAPFNTFAKPVQLIDLDVEESWLRLSGESEKAYEAFTMYRDMEPRERRLASVGQRLGKSTTLMERCSATWAWLDRAAAWDNYQE